jgi:hypothetical protein
LSWVPSAAVISILPTIIAPTHIFITSPKAGLRERDLLEKLVEYT